MHLLNTLCIKFLLIVINIFEKTTLVISTGLFLEKERYFPSKLTDWLWGTNSFLFKG